MEKSNTNIRNFQKGKPQNIGFTEHHKTQLGMDVPEDYFQNSKQSILDLVKEEKEIPVFYLRRSFQVAASVVLLLGLTIWFQFSNNTANEFGIASDDILIESLFVEDDAMNSFMEDVLVAEIVVEAEKSEQELENIFMNSLFVEDSLIEDYTKKELLDNIIL